MKPDVSMVAAQLAERLRTDMLPELTGFRAGMAGMGAAMLDMIAEQWDGAVVRLVEENRAIRGLLRDGAALFADTALRAASEGRDDDLHVSSLTRENDRLRGLLTDLHARVEDTDSADARRLDDAIWAELRRTVEARRIGSANF